MNRVFGVLLAAAVAALAALTSVQTAQAGVDIRVNLSTQTLTATTPDGEMRRWAISSGKPGHRTIRGVYRPYLLKTYHWSRKYRGHMPHAIFFKGGYAIHGTDAVRRLGTPASSGCIRLHPAAAKELFHLVKKHGQRTTRIAINGVAPDIGKTMIARAKPKPAAVAQAQAKRQVVRARAPSYDVWAPAYAPQPSWGPAHGVFQRLR